MPRTRSTTALWLLGGLLALATGAAPAAAQGVPDTAGPVVPGAVAQIVGGIASAPADAPPAVQQIIWAGNRIVGLPYRYGGGHAPSFTDTGYDCSGAVSFALRGASLVLSPLSSSGFAVWGRRGAGQWVTVLTSPGHAYLEVAGIRLDTSAAEDPTRLKGPRWRTLRQSARGFRARHPPGL